MPINKIADINDTLNSHKLCKNIFKNGTTYGILVIVLSLNKNVVHILQLNN